METPRTPAGICRTRDLIAAGWSGHDIQRARSAGSLVRLRQGWYSHPRADERAARAVRAGGALGCASALAFHGAWDVSGTTVHVHTDHNHTAPLPSGLIRCPGTEPDDRAPVQAVDDLETALRTASRCLDDELFTTCCDSLLHRRMMTMEQMARTLRGRPGPLAALQQCDRSESGTETLVRLRLRRRGVRVRTQVVVQGIGRVDLLVGERLVIEVDSRAHHTGEERYRADRARDLALMARGFLVIRLTYEQVMFDWPATEALVLDVVRSVGRRTTL